MSIYSSLSTNFFFLVFHSLTFFFCAGKCSFLSFVCYDSRAFFSDKAIDRTSTLTRDFVKLETHLREALRTHWFQLTLGMLLVVKDEISNFNFNYVYYITYEFYDSTTQIFYFFRVTKGMINYEVLITKKKIR